MGVNDPQNKRGRTTSEFFFGSTEGNAAASAKFKRGMNINPANKRLSNAEASSSYRSMDNPTSGPASRSGMKPAAKSSSSMPPKLSIPSSPAPKPKAKPSSSSSSSSMPPKLAIPSSSSKSMAPKPKAKPSMAPKPKAKPAVTSRGSGLGVTTGKITGSSATRSGTGGRAKESAYQRMMRNAREK